MNETNELPPINFLGKFLKKKSRLRRDNPRVRGTNPRAKGTNPRAKGTNPKEKDQAIFLVEDFDSFDWEQLLDSQNGRVNINE